MTRSLVFFTTVFLLVFLISFDYTEIQTADASHFRYGHIHWSPTGVAVTGGTEIIFKVDDSFRRGYTGTASDGGLAVGDIFEETIGGTTLFFGDGTNTGITYKVDAINIVENWVFAHAIDPSTGTDWRHIYTGTGPYTAKISSCCRTGDEVNNPNGYYEVSTIVDLSFANKSPVSTVPPIVPCPRDEGICIFVIPAADGVYVPTLPTPPPQTVSDSLSFRLSEPLESGDVNFRSPGLGTTDPLLVSSTGTVTWDPTNFPIGLYSTSVTLEEGRTGITPDPHGKVMLDFLINTGEFLGVAPVFDVPPTPENGELIDVTGGNLFSFTVQCSDADIGDLVTMGHLGLPTGATMEPANPIGNPAVATFKWTPIKSQAVTVSLTCQDQLGNSALFHSIPLNVQGLEIATGGPDFDGDLFCDGLTINQLIALGIYNVIDNSLNPPSTIVGTSGKDLIIASGFGDVVFGNEGDDCIIGGVGEDYLLGGNDDDQIYGWNGADILDGGSGADKMFGYDQNDILLGGSGNDHLEGEDNEDVLVGGPGVDELFGWDDVDVLFGNQGNDILNGEKGDDIVDGGQGADTINALEGSDICVNDLSDTINDDPPLGSCTLGPSTAPYFTSIIGDQTLNEGEMLSIPITADDPDMPGSILGGYLSFSSTNLPSFATLTDNGDRTATLDIAPGPSTDDTYYGIIIQVTDDHEEFPLSDYQIISIDVTGGNISPTIDGTIGAQVLDVGSSLSIPITASDINLSQVLSFSSINLPSFAILTDNGDRTATLDINPTLEEEAGTYNSILITVTDNGLPNLSDSEIIAIVVQNTGNTQPEIIEKIGSKILNPGDSLDVTAAAVDADDDNLTWTWFDLPDFVTPVDNGIGNLTLSFNPGLSDAGTYNGIALEVTDDGVPPLSASELISILVTGTAPFPSAPDNVTDLSLTVVSPTQIDLNWTTPGDNGTTITHYVIERNLNGAGFSTLELSFGTETTTSYSDSTLAVGDSVTYHIRAENGNLPPAPWSNEPLEVTTPNLPFCEIPVSGDWTITFSCLLAVSDSAPANVIVQNNSVLEILNGITLDVDFVKFNLTVKSGSSVLVRSGGTIT